MILSKIKRYCLALLLAPLALASCKDDDIKTLTELKSEQTTAITTLIKEQKMRVVELDEPVLPSKLDANVYYKLPNGLYLRVLDAGKVSESGYKPIVNETKVFVEFKGHAFNKASKRFNAFDMIANPAYPPVEFLYTYLYQYGETHYTLLAQTAPVANYDFLMCQGMAYPMALLGDGARVSLIIPFELGPSSFYAKGISTFVKEAQYTFRK